MVSRNNTLPLDRSIALAESVEAADAVYGKQLGLEGLEVARPKSMTHCDHASLRIRMAFQHANWRRGPALPRLFRLTGGVTDLYERIGLP